MRTITDLARTATIIEARDKIALHEAVAEVVGNIPLPETVASYGQAAHDRAYLINHITAETRNLPPKFPVDVRYTDGTRLTHKADIVPQSQQFRVYTDDRFGMWEGGFMLFNVQHVHYCGEKNTEMPTKIWDRRDWE